MVLRRYETIHFCQYFYIVLYGHYWSLCVTSRRGGREGERENWPLDNVGGHYRIERWLTGTKGFSLLQKSRLGIEKRDNTLLCKCTSQAKKNTFPVRLYNYTWQLWVYVREKDRGCGRRWHRVCLRSTILACTQTFIYLYIIITVRSGAARLIPSLVFSNHSPGFTVNTTRWVKCSHVSANSFIEEQ